MDQPPQEPKAESPQETFERLEARTLGLLECFEKRNPRLNRKALVNLGEFLFNAFAISAEDTKAWSIARQLQLERDSQRMQLQKLRLELRKYRDQKAEAAKTLKDTGLTYEEKQIAMKRILGVRP